jgi:hypothetical protein
MNDQSVRRRLVKLGQLIWILAGIVLPVAMLVALVVAGRASGPRPVDAEELDLAAVTAAPVVDGRDALR